MVMLETLKRYLGNGWVEADETWTYASATTFTISGDKTGKYQKGDKIKLTQTSVKYFYVINVTYSSPNTTVTVTGGSDYSLANATITSPYFSKIENPQGFPQWFQYSPTISVSGGTAPSYSTNDCRFSITGKGVNVRIALSNSSGGTAGNGTGLLVISLPITSPVNSSFLGVGIYYQATPSFAMIMARLSGTTNFYMQTYALDNILGNNQANANRFIYMNLQYPMD